MPIEVDPIPEGDASWTYSDQTYFELWNGTANTDIESDLDNDGDGNSDVLQDAGERGDLYIDQGLARIGFTVPLTGMDANTTKRLREVSNFAARWKLSDSKRYLEMTGLSITAEAIPKMALADKKFVDDWLRAIAEDPSILVCDGAPDDEPGVLSSDDPTAITGRLTGNTINRWTLDDPKGCF